MTSAVYARAAAAPFLATSSCRNLGNCFTPAAIEAMIQLAKVRARRVPGRRGGEGRGGVASIVVVQSMGPRRECVVCMCAFLGSERVCMCVFGQRACAHAGHLLGAYYSPECLVF